MLGPQGQGGTKAKTLASASKPWPWPHRWSQACGYGVASIVTLYPCYTTKLLGYVVIMLRLSLLHLVPTLLLI